MQNTVLTPSRSATPKPAGSRLGYAYPWLPDQGDGTFCNPILCADYSDPDVIRVGEDFFLTASSFNCTPGLPLLHSRDLVNWSLINHAVEKLPHPRYAQVQPGCGIWAPALRFHAGKFWIFFPMPDEGIYVTTADHPAGNWSEPHLVQAGKGLIDPCPLWDEDGKAYLVHAYAGSRAGIKHRLRVCPMAPDGSCLLGEGQVVFHQPERHPTIEGPKFLKRNGWYYLLAPAGGVAQGWQTVLRARHVFGPYEDRIVLEQGATPVNGPHQGALVDSADGRWWFVHFQDMGLYGRVVHLQPVTWQDDWPQMGLDQDGNGIGEPVLRFEKPLASGAGKTVVPATSDEFDGPTLGLQWQWHANPAKCWYSLRERPGWLRLFAQPLAQNDLSRTPHLLLQKFPAREFTVETCVAVEALNGESLAGLVVMGKAHAVLAVRRSGSQNDLLLLEDGQERRSWRIPEGPVCLRVQVLDGGVCTFAFATEGQAWTRLDELFQAQPGVWIGAKVGLAAWTAGDPATGWADFDYFRFAPVNG